MPPCSQCGVDRYMGALHAITKPITSSLVDTTSSITSNNERDELI